MESVSSFRLAPMQGIIRWLTVLIFPLPIVFVFLGLWLPGPVNIIQLGVAGFLTLLWLFIWLYYRPSRFVVAHGRLTIQWPLRRRSIRFSEIESVRAVDDRAFKDEYGRAYRIGAGGLFGGFGWLSTSKKGLVDFYISRTDGWVLITLRDHRPLLITPERPAEFVATLSKRVRPR